MVFYYALHNTLPDTPTFNEGKRNCATFLFGTILYVIIYVIVMNLKLRLGSCIDSVSTALFLIWLADCSTVGFIYKCYYGRSLLHEVGEVAGVAPVAEVASVVSDTSDEFVKSSEEMQMPVGSDGSAAPVPETPSDESVESDEEGVLPLVEDHEANPKS